MRILRENRASTEEKGRVVMIKEAEQEVTPQVPQPANEALFLSGSLALDLVNTELVIRGKKRDVLVSPDTLAAWWKEACKQYSGSQCLVEEEHIVWNTELLAAVKALRASLRNLASRVVQQQAVDEEAFASLNAVLALGYPSMQKTEQGTIKQTMRLRDTKTGPVVLPIALSALRLFTEADWQRIHKCKNDRCILYFYDTTKSGTRQWCSLGCMNRYRSVRHYRETKKPQFSS
jgi:predicted RNA-binding Zn ribbon-like protein